MGKRNPNGYGCVTKLSGNRSRPWIIKVTMYDTEGRAKQVPIDYAETEEQGNIILAQYNHNPWNIDRNKVTLVDVFQRWSKIKMPKLSVPLQSSLKSAFKHCSRYYGMKYRYIKSYHMQCCIDECGLSYSTQSAIKNLWGHLDRFAFEYDIIEKMYSTVITAPPVPETKREPFSDRQIAALWDIQDEPWVNTVLIYLYTGFRLQELLNMKTADINMKELYFRGGSKSSSGKNRIVPIHPRILPFVKELIEQDDEYFLSYQGDKISQGNYYKFWNEVMQKIGADKTPHEARHTFETNLDNAGGNRKCIDLLMGHKSKDVGNRIYNHKTLAQLRETIYLLK